MNKLIHYIMDFLFCLCKGSFWRCEHQICCCAAESCWCGEVACCCAEEACCCTCCVLRDYCKCMDYICCCCCEDDENGRGRDRAQFYSINQGLNNFLSLLLKQSLEYYSTNYLNYSILIPQNFSYNIIFIFEAFTVKGKN